MLAHSKQRQRRNITNITASTANKLGSDVLSGKLNNNNNNIIERPARTSQNTPLLTVSPLLHGLVV
jgi:hypothetical protein